MTVIECGRGRTSTTGWILEHAVEVAFGVLALGWLLYVLRISGDFYYWADDLRLIDQGRSVEDLIEPYNGHLSVIILTIYRLSSELFGLSFDPLMVIGALSLLAVPVAYFVTTRRQLSPPVAAVLAMPLLWYEGMSWRPASLNHYFALIGGIVCAGALNRGRRADGVLAGALLFSLCSAGGGVVVAGACVLHNLLVRPWLRRWLAVLVPSALYAVWWVFFGRSALPSPVFPASTWETVRIVRDLVLAPFDHAAFGFWPLGALLFVAFVGLGALQLRRGLGAGANFLAWSAAMVVWPLALAESRGVSVDAEAFRYAYLSMGFALLAVVPSVPTRWSGRIGVEKRHFLAAAAVVVLAFGFLSALSVRDDMQEHARRNAVRGRTAMGTMLVLELEPKEIPDQKPIRFFGFFGPDSAGEARVLIDRFGSPFSATRATADQELVDRGIVRHSVKGRRRPQGCQPLGEAQSVAPERKALRLWSAEPFRIEVRRFGDDWVPLTRAPGGRSVTVMLPALHSKTPWLIRAVGACGVVR